MISCGEELIPAWDIIRHWHQQSDKNDYQFTLDCYDKLGIKNAEDALEKMFVCDFILAGDDRHWNNFGVIRNTDDLSNIRIAPIFDSGGCLWHSAEALSLEANYKYMAKPFGRNGMNPLKQLELFKDLSWIDFSKLNVFTDEAEGILRQNDALSDRRISAVLKSINKNIETVRSYAEQCAEERMRNDTIMRAISKSNNVLLLPTMGNIGGKQNI